MATGDDLLEQNRILRERVEGLERGLRELSDPVLQALIEHAPAFLNVITPEGRFVATGRTSEAFGSVIGRSVFEFTEPDQHATMRAAYARICETRQPTVYESRGYGENGEPNHTYVVRAVPLIENDAVHLILLVPTDITERVRLQQSLAMSEQKLRFAVDATRMGLWSWDVARDEIHWDQRALEVFAVEKPPADFAQYLALIHPDDVAMVRGVVETTLKTGVYAPFEHRLGPRADGLERWVMGTGTLVRDGDGKPTLMMGGALDITSQKYAAAQLQRAQRVEALGQLSAGLAHNFNNLLGAIIPNLELAREHASLEQGQALDAAMSASIQARDLIKRLMVITAPRTLGGARTCDPRLVVERAVAICRATFPREIRVVPQVDPQVDNVGIDPSDLDQVVLNLLFNARDALEGTVGRERNIELALDALPGTGTHHDVRLRVRDNGMGMSPGVQARVFEPFFTTKPAHRGGGLGLADALLRVREAGGRLDCQSVEGVGTTFTVLLPGTTPLPRAAPAVATAPVGSGGETILIVDDEPALRMAIGKLLARQGYQIIEANGAAEARAVLAARGSEIKLVLLDQSMPHESGPEALPSLKRLSDAPVVLFTGGATELPPGAAALLEKPALGGELLRLAHDLIRGDRRPA